MLKPCHLPSTAGINLVRLDDLRAVLPEELTETGSGMGDVSLYRVK